VQQTLSSIKKTISSMQKTLISMHKHQQLTTNPEQYKQISALHHNQSHKTHSAIIPINLSNWDTIISK
jgi:hypothetical protein